MTRPRADLGFVAAPDGLDLSGFAPRARHPDRPTPAAVAEVAAAAGFPSREPKPASPAGQGDPPRRRRTGRSARFNLKAHPDTVAAYCALADRMGWGLGETLERAVALLEQTYGKGS